MEKRILSDDELERFLWFLEDKGYIQIKKSLQKLSDLTDEFEDLEG